jgi:release factor glutamine methyltransferase
LNNPDLGEWLELARQRLAPHSDQPRLEAAALAGFELGQPKTWILAHPETTLLPAQHAALDALLSRLCEGMPLPYLLGSQEFFGLSFAVSPAVLIPRPETELLVEEALAWLRANPNRCRAADVGTGSGCIAISLAYHIRNLHVTACDLSFPALLLARQNARIQQVENRLDWVQSDLLNPMTGPFDLVCANLPYIPTPTLENLAVAAHEPVLALDGGMDGLDLIRRLLVDGSRWLSPGGLLLLEMEASQGSAAVMPSHETFPTAQVTLLPDLAGLDRLIRIQSAQ